MRTETARIDRGSSIRHDTEAEEDHDEPGSLACSSHGEEEIGRPDDGCLRPCVDRYGGGLSGGTENLDEDNGDEEAEVNYGEELPPGSVGGKVCRLEHQSSRTKESDMYAGVWVSTP